MSYFPIQALSEETQAMVVERVAGNSFGDLYRLRAICKSMKALSERRRVYPFFDVLNFPWGSLCHQICWKLASRREISSHFTCGGFSYFIRLTSKTRDLRTWSDQLMEGMREPCVYIRCDTEDILGWRRLFIAFKRGFPCEDWEGSLRSTLGLGYVS